MNNIFVYIENEGGKAAEVCLELLTKGRELATTLGVKLEAVVLGENLAGIEHRAGQIRRRHRMGRRRQDLRTFPDAAPYGRHVRPDRAGEAPDRAVRRDLQRPRLRAARVVGALQRPYGRLHAAGDRRPQGRQDAAGSTRTCFTRSVPLSAATSSPRSSIPTTVRRWPPSAKASCAASTPPCRAPAR